MDNIKIYGYSERGAMNALFYGIAYREGDGFNGEEAIKELLSLAHIEESFDNFSFYIEGSLSGFGDPDLVIIADNKQGEKTCIFVEAKASGLGFYNLNVQKSNHEEYMNKGKDSKYEKGHSSNLFFQLRLKNLLVTSTKEEVKKGTILGSEQRQSPRRLGNNLIVNKFYNEIASCNEIKYLAIVPELPKKDFDTKNEYGFDIQFVSWEDIKNNSILGKYIKDTIDYNEVDGKSEILNN